jgi:hypothetical protein
MALGQLDETLRFLLASGKIIEAVELASRLNALTDQIVALSAAGGF